jgi:homopolymeric O-antigen transport system permease protein
MLEHFAELFRYRELIRNLVVRDLKVRYRNSLLGFLWTWGNPVLMTAVFFFVFKVLMGTPIAHFALFINIGWVVWSFTTGSITEAIGNVVGNSNLVKKIYFPREVLPLSTVLSNAVNFLLALPLAVVLILFYQININPPLLLYFPVFFLAQLALVLGIAFFLSAVNVFYRDIGVITGVLLTAWFFLTPIFYPVGMVSGLWNGIDLGRLWYILNPMASIIEGYRSILYGTYQGAPPGPPNLEFLLRTLGTCLLVLLAGYLTYLRLSDLFGEEL